jgi:hypothetical protein
MCSFMGRGLSSSLASDLNFRRLIGKAGLKLDCCDSLDRYSEILAAQYVLEQPNRVAVSTQLQKRFDEDLEVGQQQDSTVLTGEPTNIVPVLGKSCDFSNNGLPLHRHQSRPIVRLILHSMASSRDLEREQIHPFRACVVHDSLSDEGLRRFGTVTADSLADELASSSFCRRPPPE